MGSENSEQSDEFIEAQERFQEFGIGSDPSKARNFVSPFFSENTSLGKKAIERARQRYVEKQQETLARQNDFEPSARQVQEFAREQQNIDELGYNPTVEGQDIPGVSVSENQTISEQGGKVIYSSTDEKGNVKVGDEFTINQQTGDVSGDAFKKSVHDQLTPLIIAIGGL